MAYITLRAETLTDGSNVYNVHVFSDQDDMVLKFHCVTEQDALEFEKKLTCAILDHTVDEAKIGRPTGLRPINGGPTMADNGSST